MTLDQMLVRWLRIKRCAARCTTPEIARWNEEQARHLASRIIAHGGGDALYDVALENDMAVVGAY